MSIPWGNMTDGEKRQALMVAELERDEARKLADKWRRSYCNEYGSCDSDKFPWEEKWDGY